MQSLQSEKEMNCFQVKRKQQAEIDWYNAKLKTLEDAGVNVDLDKLVKTQCQLADPFSGMLHSYWRLWLVSRG